MGPWGSWVHKDEESRFKDKEIACKHARGLGRADKEVREKLEEQGGWERQKQNTGDVTRAGKTHSAQWSPRRDR